MNDVPDQQQTSLLKTFLIGMATPIISPYCFLTRQAKPRWLTKEFMARSVPVRDICYGIGLSAGVSILFSPFVATTLLILEDGSEPPKHARLYIDNKIAPEQVKSQTAQAMLSPRDHSIK